MQLYRRWSRTIREKRRNEAALVNLMQIYLLSLMIIYSHLLRLILIIRDRKFELEEGAEYQEVVVEEVG